MDYEDPINTGIIHLLGLNGRVSNKSIAKELGVSETTVANRLRTLCAQNTIQIVLQRHIHEANLASAIVEIYLDDVTKVEAAAESIARIEQVFSIYSTTTRPDLIADVHADSMRELNDVVLKMGEKVPNLRQLNTLPILALGQLNTTLGNLRFRTKQKPLPGDTEKALIALLEQDGRQSVSSLAKQLGLSITATRYRLNNLLNKPGYKISLVCDAESFGYKTWFDLRATVAPAYMRKALKRFSTNKHVRVAAHLSGPANLALFITTKSMADVDTFIQTEFKTLPGLIDFNLRHVPRVFKYDYHYKI